MATEEAKLIARVTADTAQAQRAFADFQRAVGGSTKQLNAFEASTAAVRGKLDNLRGTYDGVLAPALQFTNRLAAGFDMATRFAFGINNIVQTLKLFVSTAKTAIEISDKLSDAISDLARKDEQFVSRAQVLTNLKAERERQLLGFKERHGGLSAQERHEKRKLEGADEIRNYLQLISEEQAELAAEFRKRQLDKLRDAIKRERERSESVTPPLFRRAPESARPSDGREIRDPQGVPDFSALGGPPTRLGLPSPTFGLDLERPKKTAELSALDQAMKDLGENAFVLQNSMSLVQDAATAALNAAISGQEGITQALKKAIASTLKNIAIESTVKALLHTAEGFAGLAYGDPRATGHFVAAAKFAATAALAGGAAATLGGTGGSTVSNTPGGGFSSSGGRSSESREQTIVVNVNAPSGYSESDWGRVIDSAVNKAKRAGKVNHSDRVIEIQG